MSKSHDICDETYGTQNVFYSLQFSRETLLIPRIIVLDMAINVHNVLDMVIDVHKYSLEVRDFLLRLK